MARYFQLENLVILPAPPLLQRHKPAFKGLLLLVFPLAWVALAPFLQTIPTALFAIYLVLLRVILCLCLPIGTGMLLSHLATSYGLSRLGHYIRICFAVLAALLFTVVVVPIITQTIGERFNPQPPLSNEYIVPAIESRFKLAGMDSTVRKVLSVQSTAEGFIVDSDVCVNDPAHSACFPLLVTFDQSNKVIASEINTSRIKDFIQPPTSKP